MPAELAVDDANQVFAVYHRYDNARNRVRMTLGYRVQAAGILPVATERVEVAAGEYLTLAGGSVLGAWQDPQILPRLKYEADVERYQLDSGFGVRSQTAFVAIN